MRKERKKHAIYLCTLLLWKSSLQTVTKRDTKRDQSIWSALHARPAAEFFEQAWKKGKELSANRAGFAYLYGFICHFALDHSCHGYIEEKIQKSGVTHAEIEVEFDRMLLEKHGHNPITSHLTNHIPTDATCAGAYFLIALMFVLGFITFRLQRSGSFYGRGKTSAFPMLGRKPL